MATLPNGPFPSARDGRNRSVPRDSQAPVEAPVPLIQSMEAVLKSNQAAAAEVRSLARDVALANDLQMRMTSTIQEAMGKQADVLRAIGSGLSGNAAQVVQQVSGFTNQSPQGLWLPGGPQRAPLPQATPVADPADRSTPDRPGGDRTTQGVPAPLDPVALSNWERMQKARGYNLRQLRQDVTHWAGEKISSTQFGPNIREDGMGGWEAFNPATGESQGPATASMLRNYAIANRVRAIAGTAAKDGAGKALVNAIPKGVIGPAAAVVGGVMVADQVAQFAEQQRTANAQYQRALGGTNFEGFRERGSQALFSLSQRGTMDDRQSAELYQGVTRLGLTGNERMEALEFATRNWRRFGMEVNDSIELIRINAQNGISSLYDVANALDSVTDAAREAGVSAEAARRNFSQAYAQAAPTMVGEGTAAMTTGILSTTFTQMGQSFQGLDYSGALTPQMMTQVGAHYGMTESQMIGMATNVEGVGEFVRMFQAHNIAIAEGLLTPQGIRMIREFKASRGVPAGQPLTEGQAEELSALMLQANVTAPPSVLVQIVRAQTGISAPINRILPWLIMVVDGGWNPDAEVQEMVEASTARTMSAADRRNYDLDDRDGVSSMGEVIEAIGLDRDQSIVTTPGYMDSEGNYTPDQTSLALGSTSGLFGRQTIHTARNLYASMIHEGKIEYSPIIGKMLKDGDFDQKLRINAGTEEAPEWREMNIYDAIKHHADQIARGDVQITTGASAGQTVAFATSLMPDESQEVTYGEANYVGGRTPGRDLAERGGGSGGSTLVEVVASPELRDLLQFRVRGGATMTDPPSSMVGARDLPTGRG